VDPVVVAQLPLPVGPESPEWADFVAFSNLTNAVVAELDGDIGRTHTPEARLVIFTSTPQQQLTAFVARNTEGQVVGYGMHRRPLHDGATQSYAFVGVAPQHRRQGIGSALAERLTAEARAAGSATLECYAQQPYDDEGEQLAPEDGSGAVPANSSSTRFALRHGLRLVQVHVGSTLAVPVDPERLARAEAEAPASADAYELRTWQAPTPDDLLPGVALLRTRMATDAPSGGMAATSDPWDAQRVADAEEALLRSGRGRLYAGAVERSTGTLAAFTEIDLPVITDAPADQQYTLVLREHRGHGLGIVVKAANLRQLAAASPSTTEVKTFNADENAPMLRINRLLGFRPSSLSAAWRLDLRSHPRHVPSSGHVFPPQAGIVRPPRRENVPTRRLRVTVCRTRRWASPTTCMPTSSPTGCVKPTCCAACATRRTPCRSRACRSHPSRARCCRCSSS
jgi:GNAT superfamily N-acetyltransferase